MTKLYFADVLPDGSVCGCKPSDDLDLGPHRQVFGLGTLHLIDQPVRWPDSESIKVHWSDGSLLYVETADLNELKGKKSAAISQACTDAITSGFPCDALGAGYTYPSKFTDQLNLAGSVMDSFMPNLLADWSTPFWCADPTGEWAFRQHTAAEIQHVGRCAKAAALACMTLNEQLQAQITAAGIPADLALINWPE